MDLLENIKQSIIDMDRGKVVEPLERHWMRESSQKNFFMKL